MAGIDKEFMRTLKEKFNIVEVASGYFSLEKKGSNYWACCPFHHEKTASFSIDEGRQFYHCFGCHVSGDLIGLVSHMESLDFMQTVKLLAEKAQMELPDLGGDAQKSAELKKKRDTALKILNDTAHFYLDNLNSGKADAHVQYILSRKIPSRMVRTFGLGASLNYTDLPKYLLSKGYTKQEIVECGVVNEANGRLTDAYGGRLIFPIINAYDEVIGFGGRAIGADQKPKYVNTKATFLYDKKNVLYNINLLKKLKRTETVKEAIMVEGYIDALSLYSAGFKNVVASMGTALTPEQVRLIKRYVDTVLISYDGDYAGQNANVRGLDLLKEAGINVKVVPLPEGLDPDDVIKKSGPEGYQACLDAAMPLIDYKISVIRRGYDLKNTQEKLKYISEALKIVRTADTEAEREELLKRLRSETGVSYESLKRDLESAPKTKEPAVKEPAPKRQDDADVIKKASRYVIAQFLFEAECVQGVDIKSIEFADGVHAMIAKYLASVKLMGEKPHLSDLFEFYDRQSPEAEEVQRILDYSEGGNFSKGVADKYFTDCITKLKINAVDRRIEEAKAKMSTVSDISEMAEIANLIARLTREKEKIKREKV